VDIKRPSEGHVAGSIPAGRPRRCRNDVLPDTCEVKRYVAVLPAFA
jgi:hypothetical protein